jgi:hypothetical protein
VGETAPESLRDLLTLTLDGAESEVVVWYVGTKYS